MPLTGQLDQRITITRLNSTGQDSYGHPTYGTPTNLGTFWAYFIATPGREFASVQQRWAEAKYMIKIRRQPGITIKRDDTVEWRGQTLDVIDILGPGTREDFWTIIAKDHVE